MKFIQVGCVWLKTNMKAKEVLRKFGSGDTFVDCLKDWHGKKLCGSPCHSFPFNSVQCISKISLFETDFQESIFNNKYKILVAIFSCLLDYFVEYYKLK